MAIGLIGLAGALSYMYRSKKGITKAVWPDIIVIGLLVDGILTLLATGISIIPLGTSVSASLMTSIPNITLGPIPFWPILMTFILGFVEFMLGAVLVPFVQWLSKEL